MAPTPLPRAAPPPARFDPERRSPLRQRHAEVEERGVLRHIPAEVHRRQLLYGPGRAVRFPLIALTATKDLGPARHALSQRTVAGLAEIVFPFGPEAVPKAVVPGASAKDSARSPDSDP